MIKIGNHIRHWIFTVLFVLLFSVYAQAGELTINVLDVGQGLSVLFESDGHYLLYDGGSRDKSSYVVSYLKKQGIQTFDYIVASHYDEDHISGLVGVLNVFECNNILSPDYEADSSIYNSFVNAEYTSGAELIHPHQGQSFLLGSSEFMILGPSEYKEGLDNDNSIAIRITNQNISCLVCGDAESMEEKEIIDSGLDLMSQIYVVSHHGSNSSTGLEFLNRVSPTFAIISCGSDNAYGHPSADVMEQLQKQGCYLFRTDKQKEIILSTDGKEIYTGQDASSDWSPGISKMDNISESPTKSDEKIHATESGYVCNENSKKFHYPSCKSVGQMKEKNRRYTDQSRDELISLGYEQCKNCNP